MSFEHWTPQQWAVFTVTIALGFVVAAVLLLAGRRYVPPAPGRGRESVPRPSIVLALARTTDAEVDALRGCWREAYDNGTPAVEWLDPMTADFADPGIGALSSIQAITVDPALRTSAEISAELDAWINAYADLSGLMPETAAAAETMRCTLEPALRKAHLWRIRGEGSEQRQRLNDWRMNTPTGEYPMITTADLRPYAAALLLAQ